MQEFTLQEAPAITEVLRHFLPQMHHLVASIWIMH